ncbi:MAG: carboxypeptidase-like regulatory domain-containing protein [Chitinophagaceae bacterium]|nr:carboxypeptidase-like regulatory domain-containing protein [Chitinophagaceae bacterium]MCW5926163.1 carboxypeptidase-like regulatory domain-containing protein [Chitinophagaceae bacterium]
MGKNILITIGFLFSFCCGFSQGRQDIRQKSWQSLVYRITAADAEKLLRTGEINPDAYLDHTPVATWHADTAAYEYLPVGNYLILRVNEYELVAGYYCQSNIRVFPINNKRTLQLEIRDNTGNPNIAADVWLNGKKQNKSPGQVCTFKKSKIEEAIVKVAIPGDTLFVEATALEEEERSRWQQWWSNFYHTKPVWAAGWPVRTIKRLVQTQPGYWFERNSYRVNSTGYMIFNQPRYKPGDTVQFKAYVISRKGKQYKKTLENRLQYYSRNGYVSSKLGTLQPETPGAYVHRFVLGDSLVSDKNYSLQLVNKKGKVVLAGSFKIEDYLLDEIASYSLSSEKDRYFAGDTLVFYAKAQDASGLPLMDGRVNLLVQPGSVAEFYRQQVFIADTLWQQEKPLAVEGLTRFEIPASALPDADIQLNVKAVFRNSNNELQEETLEVKLVKNPAFIEVWQEGGEVVARVRKNGAPVPAEGALSYGDEDKELAITYPFRQKINPYVEDYFFWADNKKDSTGISRSFEPDEDMGLRFSRIQEGDTTGFLLQNPWKMLVHYTVLYGNRIYASGKDTVENIVWKTSLPHNRIYTVTWNYIWKGEERHGYNTVAVLDKLLNTSVSGAATIYPGQTDTVTITVEDYKGKPAAAVNLTAVSYNKQFGTAIRVPEPPYLDRFKSKRRILIDGIELDEAFARKSFLLREHQGWRKNFHLDTMEYYRLLFPEAGEYSVFTPISDFQPQLSVFMVQDGKPLEVYMLYINRKPVWYNGVTDKSYVFRTPPGYVQLGIRLKDSYIEIDSVYMQPYYKRDISFDLHRKLPNFRREERPAHYTAQERNQLEQQIFRLKDNGGGGYAWQSGKLTKITGGTVNISGPFTPNEMITFFRPGSFDISFPFEPGYEYSVSRQMARLEKKPLFLPKEEAKLPNLKTSWSLRDTLKPPPVISYEPTPAAQPYLRPNDHLVTAVNGGSGRLLITLPGDTVFAYAVLYQKEDPTINRIKNYALNRFDYVVPGNYNLILITAHGRFISLNNIDIQADGGTYLKVERPLYETNNIYADRLHMKMLLDDLATGTPKPEPKNEYTPRVLGVPLPGGNAGIEGVVTDNEGKEPVAGASVYLKGYNAGVATDEEGRYSLKGIKPGRYTVVFSFIGYEPRSVDIQLYANAVRNLDAALSISELSLEEVVVVGYGMQKKRSLTGAVMVVEEGLNVLQGKAAGIQVTDYSQIQVRGINSINGNTQPLYIVNGVPMDELPANMDMTNRQINVLKGDAALSLYGARAAGGAIVVTTGDFSPKAIRDKFRDYAIWQPNLLTGKDGKVRFTVTYPDNITGWETWVVGMDKKKRITKTSSFVKSFKPMLAQLALPSFLIEGDSSVGIGKLSNYTTESAGIITRFIVNDSLFKKTEQELSGKASTTEKLVLQPGKTEDTLTVQYNMETAFGYRDGEIRKIPVYKKGTEETRGSFWILESDTVITFKPDPDAGDVVLYARNNTLEVLLDELQHLKNYPYFCMEQTASKLTGLLLEKQIRKTLGQPFKEEKDIQKLADRLLKAQSFSGGWGWWTGNTANFNITGYILRALMMMKDDPLVKTALRNGGLYLQNELPGMQYPNSWNRSRLITALYTLSEMGHVMDYTAYLYKIPFDSLTVHDQWQVINIKQRQQLDYQREMETIMKKRIETVLGGLHWGADNWYWESNEMATTVLAYKVLRQDKMYEKLTNRLIYYFLERRKPGRWRNTVESASICAAVLPDILKMQPAFQSPSGLTIQADQTTVHEKFPIEIKLDKTTPVTIDRTGGGLLYVTVWQKIFNPAPEAVTDNFVIHTQFRKSGTGLATLQAGEKAVMRVQVEALKDAEYVQIEVPIPAGCTYGAKPQTWTEHREYLKEKMVLFVERMPKGKYSYEIELEPRYAGEYHLNPAKAELMYFPMFYGQNGMSRIEITGTADN